MDFEFYKTADGERIANYELSTIQPETLQKQIAKKLAYYKQKTFLELSHSGVLEKTWTDNLWELKFLTSPPYRSLCLLTSKLSLVILHTFAKKYNGKIKSSVIDVALGRSKIYKEITN